MDARFRGSPRSRKGSCRDGGGEAETFERVRRCRGRRAKVTHVGGNGMAVSIRLAVTSASRTNVGFVGRRAARREDGIARKTAVEGLPSVRLAMVSTAVHFVMGLHDEVCSVHICRRTFARVRDGRDLRGRCQRQRDHGS